MKKFLSLLLAAALIACLCAFGAELEAHSEGDLQRMLDQLVEQATAK